VKRVLPWVLLAVLVAGGIFVATRGEHSRTAKARATALESEFRCVECQSLSVADSQSTTAQAMRVDIGKRIAAGESDTTIRRAYVERYGEFILLKPRGDDGLGLVVWGLPVLLFVVAAGGLVVALRRWRAQPRLAATPADEALVDEIRKEAKP
jgi:cytochrome c-type biogenesis protein CcmH